MSSLRGIMISPCVGLCKLDPDTRICEGCGRSQMEIFMWTKYSDCERMEVMNRLGYGKRKGGRKSKDIPPFS